MPTTNKVSILVEFVTPVDMEAPDFAATVRSAVEQALEDEGWDVRTVEVKALKSTAVDPEPDPAA